VGVRGKAEEITAPASGPSPARASEVLKLGACCEGEGMSSTSGWQATSPGEKWSLRAAASGQR